MNLSIKKCDACGIEVRSDSEKEKYESWFENVTIGFGAGYGGVRHTHSKFRLTNHSMLLCEPCMEKLGITRISSDASKVQPPPMPQDVLYELVCDIVRDVVANSNQ